MEDFDTLAWVSSVNNVSSLVTLAKKYNGVIEEQTERTIKVRFSSARNRFWFCRDLKMYYDFKFNVSVFAVLVHLV
jgi:hypothetical protein